MWQRCLKQGGAKDWLAEVDPKMHRQGKVEDVLTKVK